MKILNRIMNSTTYRKLLGKAVGLFCKIPITYHDGIFDIRGLKVRVLEDTACTLQIVDYPYAYPDKEQERAIHRILDFIP